MAVAKSECSNGMLCHHPWASDNGSFAQFTAASASASVALLRDGTNCAKAVSEGSATEKSQHYGSVYRFNNASE